jgi:arabinofuranan 3-O-arabinosyltransferase
VSRAEDAIFTKRRLALCGYAFLAANVIALAIRFLAGKWVIDKAGHPTYVDFLNWWVAGKFALMRNAAGAYDYPTFSAGQAAVAKSAPPQFYFYWVYPPTMLLLLAPFALLPYLAAFFAWIATTLTLFAIALYAILPEVLTVVLALLPLPVVMNVFIGQTAFLTAGLLGLSLVFMSRRPYLSGICLGILTYKPQFILFFPLALVITRQWRVIAAATASALLFAGVAVLMFGSNAWLLFLRSLRGHNPATFLAPNVEGMNQTVFGLMHWVGAGIVADWVVHLAVAVLMTVLTWQIWLRPVPHSLKAAAFSIGVLIATPYMLLYDLTAVSVPAAFLITDALARGFFPGERLVLLGCFLVLFLCFNFSVGPIVLIVLMGLVLRRVSYEEAASATVAAAVPELGIV